MANICFTTVFIEGKRDKLQEFVDYYCEIENKLVEKENAIPAVLKGLKLNTKNIDFRSVKILFMCLWKVHGNLRLNG